MDASEGSVNRIGRTIWTVWGYLTGAVARYLRPEVTNEGNQNVNCATDDTVFRSTTKQADRQVKETNVEKEQGEKNCNQNEENTAGIKCLLPEARVQVATAQWEKTDVVNEDSNELNFDSTIKQGYHSVMRCTDTDKQEGDITTPDVQKNIENEPKQTKSEAHIEKEVASSDGSWAEFTSNKDNIKFKGSETKQTEDIEQNEGTKEGSDHYNEDDDETYVMKREDSDDTEVTVQSVLGQDLQQKKSLNKMDYKKTEDTRTECIGEEVVLEATESDEDKEMKSLEKDKNLLPKLVCSTEDEADLPKPFESEKLREMEKHLENIKCEGIEIPERQEDIISKDVVDLPETRGPNEQGEHIEAHEQHKCIDSSQLASTDIFIKKAQEKRLGEIQTAQTKSGDKTQSQLKSVERLPRLSRQTFEENVTCNELGLKTTTVVHKGVDKTFDASEDTIQSASSVQCFSEIQNLLSFVATETDGMFVCDLPGEPRKGPEMGSVNTGTLDQITKVATSLGFFEEIKANIYEPPILTENVVSCSKLELKRTSLNDTLVEAIEFEQDIKIPISSVELGTKQIQTLKEMAKFTLKECDELRTKLLVETTKREIDFEEKAEDFMTASQADNKIFELNIEKECTTMDTIIESLKKGKWDSSIEINRKELNAEQTPDVTEANTELIRFLSPAEVLDETLDFQDKSERYPEKLEDIKVEFRLLGETESLTTVESVEKIMNQVLKETLEMENKFMQEIELSSETPFNVEFQRPTECLPTCAQLLEEERELLGTVESLVELEVKAGIYEAVKKLKDQHNISSPECEPTDADRGFEQLEKDTVGETLFHSNDGISEINRPGLKRRPDDMSKDLPKVKDQKSPLVRWSTTVDFNEQQSSLDFSVQRSRIAVKNPLVRPPKDPRKLLNKISMEPSLPNPPPCGLLKGSHGAAVSVQSKGVIGFKLPGMVTELPTLRKTEFGRKVREEEKAESTQQKEQKSVAETENSVKQEQASLKPKWTPPKHPGMGSPFMMAELKSKLKTPVKE